MINASLAAAATSHPLLRHRAAAELPEIVKVRSEDAGRLAVVAMQADDPVGVERLQVLTDQRLTEAA